MYKICVPNSVDIPKTIKLLKLKPGLQDKVNKIYSTYKDKHIVGVYYRHGNGELDGKRELKKPKDYYKVLPKLMNKQTDLYVSTDNFRFVCNFIDKYKEKVIHRYKWYPTPDTGGRCHNSKYCPDNEKLLEDAIIDIWLLSKCNSIIYNNSWFVRIAMYLSNGYDREINM